MGTTYDPNDDFQRRSSLLNAVGRRLLARSGVENQRIADRLENILQQALHDVEHPQEPIIQRIGFRP
jgi:hypothetical protein